ncbi:MAG: hypothetical protein JKX85_01980 [Phycisphaeraceae bacterium]|nr:hypothetical protein [Phycisphaeraceae bacterium]
MIKARILNDAGFFYALAKSSKRTEVSHQDPQQSKPQPQQDNQNIAGDGVLEARPGDPGDQPTHKEQLPGLPGLPGDDEALLLTVTELGQLLKLSRSYR